MSSQMPKTTAISTFDSRSRLTETSAPRAQSLITASADARTGSLPLAQPLGADIIQFGARCEIERVRGKGTGEDSSLTRVATEALEGLV